MCEELRAIVDELGGEADPIRRRLKALGALTERLAADGVEPILVGGFALSFYTAGGYSTSDVDLALPNTPEVDAAFADLGFEKDGRFWIRPELDLYFEAPAPPGLPGEDAPRTRLEIDGLPVVVIGREDLLLDRLRAWVHWTSAEDERWCRRLVAMYASRLDWTYLAAKVEGDAGERTALDDLRAGVERP